MKFQDSELESRPLSDKIEYVLDELMGVIPGLFRKDVTPPQIADESESNDDY
jgi:hypothetical protein